MGATSTTTSGVTTFGVELVNTSASTYNTINVAALAEEWFSGANPTGGGLTFQYGIVAHPNLNPISASSNTANYQTDTALSFVNTAGGNAPVPGGEKRVRELTRRLRTTACSRIIQAPSTSTKGPALSLTLWQTPPTAPTSPTAFPYSGCPIRHSSSDGRRRRYPAGR